MTRERITRHKRGEKLQEIDYRALVEQLPALIYVQELGEPGLMRYLSPHTEAMLGHPPHELMGEDWQEIIHPEDRQRVAEEAARAVSAGGTFQAEYRLISREGRTVWVRDEAVITQDQEGCSWFRRGVLFDITERKGLENRLEHQAFHDPVR